MLSTVEPWVGPYRDSVDGLVVTGGAGLNVVANQALRNSFGLDVFVNVAPNDCGLGLGLVRQVAIARQSDRPVALKPAPVTYLGFPTWDEEDLRSRVERHEAVLLRGVEGRRELARLLVEEGAIVGVVRGRQEVGPRALGHRSLLGFPDTTAARDRMNRLKARQWYRPVAPVVPRESLHDFFEDAGDSPYMSFAPRLKKEAADRFPAITHVDGTARVQSVTSEEEGWLHDLLRWVGLLSGGWPILMNTSFNTKVHPHPHLTMPRPHTSPGHACKRPITCRAVHW